MRPKNPTPSYNFHSQSGRARACWTDANGRRREIILPGKYNSSESKAAYAKIVAEVAVSPVAVVKPTGTVSVNEMALAYLDFAKRYYVKPDGTTTSELVNMKCAVRALRELYGTAPAESVGPLALRAIQKRLIDAKLCRSEINRRIDRIRRVYKWAVSEQLVPVAILEALKTVPGLRRGRTEARETDPIGPVDPVTLEETLPLVNRQIRGLIEFQRHTGCRPGEACSLRMADVDRAGPIWWYRPADHKNAYRGRGRAIAIGPKLQAILADYPTDDPTAYVFSPSKAVEEITAIRSAARQTPRYASHLERNARKRIGTTGKRRPKDRYTTASYGRAIERAIESENERRKAAAVNAGGKAEDARLIPWWQPNRIRHLVATEIRKTHGIEVAKSVLGHATISTTEIYAEKDMQLVERIAALVG